MCTRAHGFFLKMNDVTAGSASSVVEQTTQLLNKLHKQKLSADNATMLLHSNFTLGGTVIIEALKNFSWLRDHIFSCKPNTNCYQT